MGTAATGRQLMVKPPRPPRVNLAKAYRRDVGFRRLAAERAIEYQNSLLTTTISGIETFDEDGLGHWRPHVSLADALAEHTGNPDPLAYSQLLECSWDDAGVHARDLDPWRYPEWSRPDAAARIRRLEPEERAKLPWWTKLP